MVYSIGQHIFNMLIFLPPQFPPQGGTHGATVSWGASTSADRFTIPCTDQSTSARARGTWWTRNSSSTRGKTRCRKTSYGGHQPWTTFEEFISMPAEEPRSSCTACWTPCSSQRGLRWLYTVESCLKEQRERWFRKFIGATHNFCDKIALRILTLGGFTGAHQGPQFNGGCVNWVKTVFQTPCFR